ncbi:MAG: hypothetical protein M3R02_05760 [Chloroflexota bacterium]|nr:hypothetical protein [Chloroflexota bacterium]
MSNTGDAPDLALLAWEQRKDQLEKWLSDWKAVDERRKANPVPLSPGVQATLDQKFTWHPQYKGRTYDDVQTELCQQVREAKVRHMLWTEHPSPSVAMRLEAMAINVDWSRFGGADWLTADESELALERLGLELAKEFHKKPDYDFADYLRDWQDFARYGPETNLQVFWRKSRWVIAIVVAIVLLALLLI